MFFKNSGQRRLGAGEYTVAATEAGAFVISQGKLTQTKLAKFASAESTTTKDDIAQVSDGTFNITTNTSTYFCIGTSFRGFGHAFMNSSLTLLTNTSFIEQVRAHLPATMPTRSHLDSGHLSVLAEIQ